MTEKLVDVPLVEHVGIDVAASDGEEEVEKAALFREAAEYVTPDVPARSSRVTRVVVLCLGLAVMLFFSNASNRSTTKALIQDNIDITRASEELMDRIGVYLPDALSVKEKVPEEPHPILPLLRKARIAHAEMLERQSQTLQAAGKKYVRRYGKKPPPGFPEWWNFARARNHTLIDEYDGLMRDLAPFAALSPAELKARTATLAQLPGVSIVSIKNGSAEVHSRSGRWAPALAFQEMIENFVRRLPDVDIAINERQEARILPESRRNIKLAEWGAEEVEPAITANRAFSCLQIVIIQPHKGRAVSDPLSKYMPFRADWKRDGSTWEVYRRACPPDSAARRLIESMRSAESADKPRNRSLSTTAPAPTVSGDGAGVSRRRTATGMTLPPSREVTFIAYPDAGLDVCSRPSLHGLHSAFFSDTRSIPYLYPLFSPSKPAGFADIRIPSHHYWSPSSEYTYDWELKRGRTRTSADVEWAEKDNKAFWRGKVTRGADTPEGHSMTFQKQRLVALANDDGGGLRSVYDKRTQTPALTLSQQPRRTLVALNATTSALRSVSAPLGAINNVTLDVAMACDPKLGECIHQSNLGLKVESPGPLSDVWKHKYALDLDEIGFSPRFFALMESKCAVVKSTIQREFWSDWTIPWYHYIPLSGSFGELHNIQAFFTGLPTALVDEANAEQSRIQQDAAERLAAAAEATAKPKKGALAKDRTAKEKPLPPAPLFVTSELVTDELEPVPVPPLDPSHGPVFNGDTALRGIAEHGATWRRQIVRKEDMEIYIFRLIIEYAALLREDR